MQRKPGHARGQASEMIGQRYLQKIRMDSVISNPASLSKQSLSNVFSTIESENFCLRVYKM